MTLSDEHTVLDKVKDSQAIKGLRAQSSARFIDFNPYLLFWIFVVASIIGLILEDIFHAIVYGGWESRAGLVWGPFSPLYGLAGVVVTVFLNRLYYTHNIIIFLFSMVVGSCLEYFASLGMEVVWHAIAWDYTGTFGSIDGRTNFVFGVMWGALGLFWVRGVMPVIKKCAGKIDFKDKTFRALTILFAVFMAINIAVTVVALHRAGDRTHDIPPANQIDVMLDEYFPDEWLQQRFTNMTVSADVGADNAETNEVDSGEAGAES